MAAEKANMMGYKSVAEKDELKEFDVVFPMVVGKVIWLAKLKVEK